ncbi:MAG: hypothetical protein HYR96_13670 [Deltaproteobacteria bacterium]|nr:hypothetical protein [Deltaproteobacteria bacterium]MBI3293826.1 hypothetical protein [Deltaproteobacteria bacterium]
MEPQDPLIYPFFCLDSADILRRLLPEVEIRSLGIARPSFLAISNQIDAAHTIHLSERGWKERLVARELSGLLTMKKGLINNIEVGEVRFADESAIKFDQILWGASLARLAELGGISPSLSGKAGGETPRGAIEILFGTLGGDSVLSSTDSFGFRFKEFRSVAHSFHYEGNQKHRSDLYVCTMPGFDLTNHEEQAKFVKALRREILVRRKDGAPGAACAEKIVHYPLSPLTQRPANASNRHAPNIYYIGAEHSLEEVPADARHFEVALHNARSTLVSTGHW